MIFLIEYDRARGKISSIERFSDSRRAAAEDSRLRLELRLNHAGIDAEVVLLEAESDAALQRTHRRYFEDAVALANPAGERTEEAEALSDSHSVVREPKPRDR